MSRWSEMERLVTLGALPRVVPTKIAATRGEGERCMVCARVVTAVELAFEVPAGDELVVLDRGCFNLWLAVISQTPERPSA
jgi:hypothetical protein